MADVPEKEAAVSEAPSASDVLEEANNVIDATINSSVEIPTVAIATEVVAAESANVKAESAENSQDMANANATIDTAAIVEGALATAQPIALEVGKSEEGGAEEATSNLKRSRDDDEEAADGSGNGTADLKLLKTDGDDDADPIPASKEGTSFFNDADVLSGRGGGTNVHPGNRTFRDLINLHRRAYLKARKNDKPAISRAIVRSIRDGNGRFLRKDDKSGLWFEIGDDAAREKTSQALRQRAPEMRKLLFDTEREEARSAAEDHLRHQRMMMGMPPDGPPMPTGGMPGMPPGMAMPPMAFPNPAFFQAMAANGGKPPGTNPNGQDPYQMFQAAIMGNNMSRFPAANGGS